MRTARTTGLLALTLLLAGCVITPEGIEDVEILLADILPPSRVVGSYIQKERPKPPPGDGMEVQLGGKTKLDVMKKWGSWSTLHSDYGLLKGPPKVRITVSEMSTRLQAYGAYTNLRPGLLPENAYVKIGTHGTVDGERLIFVHDLYLVVVRLLEPLPPDQARSLLIQFGRATSNRIPRSLAPIPPVSFLPQEGRVVASERLDKDDPLGLDILKDGAASALYRKENQETKKVQEAKVFLALVEEALLRRSALTRYQDLMKKEGEVGEVPVGDSGYKGKLQGKACMIAQRENVLFGVIGNMDEAEMQNLLAVVDRRIKPFVPAQYKDLQKAKENEEKKATFSGE